VRTGDRWVRNWDGGGVCFAPFERADQGGSNDPKFMAVAWLLAVWQSFERGPVIFFLWKKNNFFLGVVDVWWYYECGSGCPAVILVPLERGD
jgi:hypothetical protein